MQLKTIQTRLENADRDEIAVILNDKAMTQGANATVDYIGFALENIESAKDRIKNAINELRQVSKGLDDQAEIIKAGVSDWMTSNGVEKLKGDRISSISVFDKKESKELVIDSEEAVINAGYFKMVADKTAAKEALLNGIAVDGCHIEITYQEPSIRLNKKRLKNEAADS